MLDIRNLSVIKGKKEILKEINLSVKPHTITAVIGKNGSGKSTLLSCLTSESKYTGTIHYEDKNLSMMTEKQRAGYISLLPQSLPSVPITVERLVAMGRTPYMDLGKNLSQKDKEQIERAIADVGIEELRHKKLTELSGGEKQKAYIAMVLSQNTRIIALDEPTTYMDIQFQKEFLSLLKELKEKHKKTLVVVMHDLGRAAELADYILILSDGKAVDYGKKEEVLQNGKIESTFNVKKYEAEFDGEKRIIFR